MVCAMDANGDGRISRSELAALLHTIGAAQQQQQQLTDEDLQAIIDELGEQQGEHEHEKQIPIHCVEDLILNAGKVKHQNEE
jgi:Ca2+-binding EF-hand superfamily protein